ncbi:MAG: hypothetical protein KKE30_12255 [Gammaproteobacteria bacterium]|nr:hypothetical protein [Gammaproteobacteria bacterium]MBU1554805.1 hypothetical protein [Gammaproteobacteria bacterium]MBU2070275.1 hypothetical protein [Gammaproteobacteria bacterium]MBU2183978.1 hypothetical protein [Gammaproteobacteria bacterium]MBU2206782.1 hypothetical protein [Gammaproteobacteria bacterium]
MTFEIRTENQVIGITELEGGDPPMGFAFGKVEPTDLYGKCPAPAVYRIYDSKTGEEVASELVTVEDHSTIVGHQCIEVTILIKSSKVYRKFFKHHVEAYEKKFK